MENERWKDAFGERHRDRKMQKTEVGVAIGGEETEKL